MRISRLTPGNDGYSLEPIGDPFGYVAAIGAVSECDFTSIARVILELTLELEAIEEDRREGCTNSPDLVDRCLTVWFTIKQVNKTLNSLNRRA